MTGAQKNVGRNPTRQWAVCFGFFQPKCLGEIYRQTMAIGKIPTVDFAAGEIKAFGKNCWKIYPQNLNWSGWWWISAIWKCILMGWEQKVETGKWAAQGEQHQTVSFHGCVCLVSQAYSRNRSRLFSGNCLVGGDGGRNAVGGQRLRYQYNSEIYKRARKDSGNPSKA